MLAHSRSDRAQGVRGKNPQAGVLRRADRSPQRRLFFDRLSQALAHNERSGQYGAVIYLDLDNFKPLNDQYGHLAGDLLLQEVGRRLAHCIREQDTVARLGGDVLEACCCMWPTISNPPRTWPGRWPSASSTTWRGPYVMSLDEQGSAARKIEHLCSASLGMTLFPPRESDSETILRRADRAMYQARARANKICLAESISGAAVGSPAGVPVRSVGWLGIHRVARNRIRWRASKTTLCGPTRHTGLKKRTV